MDRSTHKNQFSVSTVLVPYSTVVPCYSTDQLELELIQTQMAQKPMLRAEVYAYAMRASRNRKKEVRVLLRFDQ